MTGSRDLALLCESSASTMSVGKEITHRMIDLNQSAQGHQSFMRYGKVPVADGQNAGSLSQRP